MRGMPGLVSLPVIALFLSPWGVGTTLAVGAAPRALRRPIAEQGIVALGRQRPVGAAAHPAGRVGGLVIVLAIAVAGGTLVRARGDGGGDGAGLRGRARASAAAIAFAVAFAVTLGPVAMATLGGRSFPGG